MLLSRARVSKEQLGTFTHLNFLHIFFVDIFAKAKVLSNTEQVAHQNIPNSAATCFCHHSFKKNLPLVRAVVKTKESPASSEILQSSFCTIHTDNHYFFLSSLPRSGPKPGSQHFESCFACKKSSSNGCESSVLGLDPSHFPPQSSG